MELRKPFAIGPRLWPALKIGNGFISIWPMQTRDDEGRIVYEYAIDDSTFHVEYEGQDLRSGCWQELDIQDAMLTLIAFLLASADCHEREMRKFPAEGSENWFPQDVAHWAYANQSEIAWNQLELESDQNLITY